MRSTTLLLVGLVTLPVAAGCFGAPPEPGPSASIHLYVADRIWTADPDKPFAEALAVENGTILFVGSEGEARVRYRGVAQTLLSGQLVLPGLIDSHTHFLRVATNWNCDATNNPFLPTYDTSQLAAAAFERSRLERGLSHQQTNASGTTPAHGTASFADKAVAARGVVCGMRELNALGLTMTVEAGMLNWAYFDLLRELEAQGSVTVRQSLYIGPSTFDEAQRRGASTDYGSDLVRVAGTKYYSDGWLGPRTAALLAPYSDRPWSRGVLFLEQGEADRDVALAKSLGLKIATHTIGDHGLAVVLNAYTKAGLNASHRPTFEHASVIPTRLHDALRDLGAILSYQLSFPTSDQSFAEAALGRDRLPTVYAWKTLQDHGILLAGGSDFPIETISPFWGLQRVVTRQELDGRPPGGWQPSERLSVEEALLTITRNAAYNVFMEDRVGSLEAGKRADFVVIDRDLFTISPTDIARTCVLETYVDGRKVHDEATRPTCTRVMYRGDLAARAPGHGEAMEALLRVDGPLTIP